PDPLAGDVERVVAASVEEPVAVLVDGRPVAVRPYTGEAAPVRVEVALGVAPHAAGHARPRPPADELSDLAAHGVAVRVDHVHVLPERGEAERHWLDRLDDARAQEARADLGAAGDVDDRRPAAADVLEQPEVRVAVPRLAGRADRPQRRQVVRGLAL